MSECSLQFSSSFTTDKGSFKLLELPSELLKLIEASGDEKLRLVIKGSPDEDAVLCTPNKTYSLRSVVLSNTVLVVTPKAQSNLRGDEGDVVVIRDELNEIMEMVPAVPKLNKLDGLLRGMEYDEGEEDAESASDPEARRPNKRRRITYDGTKEEIQASDTELANSLRARHILVLNGCLRPINQEYLHNILELLLNYIVSLSLDHQAASVHELTSNLAVEHQISQDVSTQVMSWFGELHDGRWKMDVRSIMREVGIGILRNFKDRPVAEHEFLTKWKSAVGDSFESNISLQLLTGNYLSSTSHTATNLLTYFPASSLPSDAAARFADLFQTRPRWKNEDIVPFLADIAIDSKERDQLLLKYARTTTDSDGIWFTARAKYNG